jgi:hypothetical protein
MNNIYKRINIVIHLIIILILTVITQIGRLAYILSIALIFLLRILTFLVTFFVFMLFYSVVSFVSSMIAPLFGRFPLSCFASSNDRLVVASPIYCALNRNYTTPQTRKLAIALAEDIDREYPGTLTIALDANFPFVDGFPLLPHLSHDDGKKLDLAFYYRDAGGKFLNGKTRSPVGYFAFEQPAASDEQPCKGRNDWLTTRWDFDAIQPVFPKYELEERRTTSALRWLTTEGVNGFGLEKVFLEPHIRNKLGVADTHLRFQGCRAARHDGHIHIQVR